MKPNNSKLSPRLKKEFLKAANNGDDSVETFPCCIFTTANYEPAGIDFNRVTSDLITAKLPLSAIDTLSHDRNVSYIEAKTSMRP